MTEKAQTSPKNRGGNKERKAIGPHPKGLKSKQTWPKERKYLGRIENKAYSGSLALFNVQAVYGSQPQWDDHP